MAKPTSKKILEILLLSSSSSNGEKTCTSSSLLKEQVRANSDATFFYSLVELKEYQLIDRKVHDDRTVSYTISDFGRFIVEDSITILNRIKEEFK